MSHDGVGPRAISRSAAFLTAGALAVSVLAGCSSDDEASRPLAGQDIAATTRDQVADGGTLHWAVDALPETLNSFQADADTGTNRIAQAVLPSMFRIDANGSPVSNADYLESAKVIETEPRQVVLYKLNQQAVWSDGREIGAADFAAQWRALSGKDTAYWTARNAGYDRIEKIERGANDLEVRVTFNRPYADWKALFSPLYPKDIMGTPDAFNDGARRELPVTAGPFRLDKVDTKAKDIVLNRNPRWWGQPAKLSELVLRAVPRDQRATAMANGTVDLADIDPADVERINLAAQGSGGAPVLGSGRTSAKQLRSWALAHGLPAKELPEGTTKLREKITTYLREQTALRDIEVRKSLEPSYTQLALNGSGGPLADERVRRAVARAIDRKELAKAVLGPLGLPAEPVGSHLALSGQPAYTDGSGSLGTQDATEAQALLGDAGWVRGGPVKEQKPDKAAGAQAESEGGQDGAYVVGEDDDKAPRSDDGADSEAAPQDDEEGGAADRQDDGEDAKSPPKGDGEDSKDPGDLAERQGAGETGGEGARPAAQEGGRYTDQHPPQGGAPGAYAPRGTAAPAAVSGPFAKDGKALSLRFVVPSGAGSESLRTVADRIARMLDKVGIGTEISKVPDEGYFKDHIASGQFDLALYSWPSSAFPATDARPIYAKPLPAADGSVNVEQNYTRVGTDQVDQLFDQAVATLDEGESRSLIRKADSRIWAAAGSLPLYQRPQLTAVRKNLVNAGSFGFQTPVYEDLGFLKKGAQAPPRPSAS
ncbi:ABC transporter substrate-binding protein [Streptomyces sp. MMS24-I2-30]|uniref:ABC transporter substrate-binding protein n=1 Tax=Streptomyces sp. MMS24-I2-30 TaxID=3351564 RepID=UPI003896C709